MKESLYSQWKPVERYTFNSEQDTRRQGTVVGTPKFSNWTINSNLIIWNYINTRYDFSGKSKFTVRIRWAFIAWTNLGISQWDSSSNRVMVWYYNQSWWIWILSVANWSPSANWRYIDTTWWYSDMFFVYNWSWATNADRAKIYKNWVALTLTLTWTIGTTAPKLISKNSRIGNMFNSIYESCWWAMDLFEIYDYPMWSDEVQAIYNNSKYRNYNPIMDLKRWIKISWTKVEKYSTIKNSIIDLWQKYFENTVLWIDAYPTKQAYWTWEFKVYSWTDWLLFHFISDKVSIDTANSNWYYVWIWWNWNVFLSRKGSGVILLNSAGWYAADNTRYSFKITRTLDWVFTMYIKWWVYTVYTLVSTSWWSWTNPVTNTTHTSSNFMIPVLYNATSLVLWSRVSDIRFKPYI